MGDGRGSLGQERGGEETVQKTLRKSDGDRRAGESGTRAWDGERGQMGLFGNLAEASNVDFQSWQTTAWGGQGVLPQVGHMCGVPAADAL